MYYTQSKLIRPIYGEDGDAERWIPREESLRGVLFDYSDSTVVTYDKVENKLLWVESSTGAIVQSATVGPMHDAGGGPVDDILGMCQFGNVIYMLVHEGNSQLAVFTGSLQVARETAFMPVTRYGVPPYGAYARYNIGYCNIFNIGASVYLLLSVTFYPPNTIAWTNQYIVEFDLLGLFRNAVQVDLDNSTNGTSAPNGLGVAACWHNNVIALLCKTNISNNNNVVWHLRIAGGVLVYEKQEFVYGPVPIGSDIDASGRHIYSLVGNRIFKSEIMRIKVAMEEGWPSTHSIDLGTLMSGQAVIKRLRIQNVSPGQTYKGLTAYTSDPNLLLSKENSPDRLDYAESILLTDTFSPNATLYIWVCLIAPTLTDEKVSPVQYYDYIYFKALEVI